MKRVLVFGTFDGLHAGHKFLLQQASALGDELYVGVACDEHVFALKHKRAHRNQNQRLRAVRAYPGVHKGLLCDRTLGSFGILDLVKPDLIVMGHDQETLHVELRAWLKKHHRAIRMVRAKKYEADQKS